ncbi:MAG: MerR family transcriptional regulator [Kofleriaceae bacterium]
MPAAAPPAPPPSSTAPPALTIDELAARAGVPTRTIRFYQAKGALMKPAIRGRVAFYGDDHVERLKLIAQLQDRGLRIDAIRDLVTSIDAGLVDLAEWLGVEHAVQAPWADDAARTVDAAGLAALTGAGRPGLVAELTRHQLIERRGEVFLIPSPALLGIALKLAAAGIDLGTAAAAAEILRKHLRRAVADLVELFVRGVQGGQVTMADPEATFTSLRPQGIEAVKVLFAREMEHALRGVVESGQLAKLGRRRRKR